MPPPTLNSEEPQKPTRGLLGLAAVPVGGGGAWPGFEIDHSEPSGSRVAISRAGRRPRAHKAARPWPQVARRPYGALHKGDACSVRCRGPVYLPTRPTHKRSRDRFPGHGLVNECASALNQCDEHTSGHCRDAHDRDVASDRADLVAVDLVLNLERRRLQACFNLELHAFSSSYSHRFGTRSCFSTSQFLSVSIRESARPMPIATIVNMTVKSAASASSICWLFR